MSASIAVNKRTGEVLALDAGGQWKPAQVARNPQTGQSVAFDGNAWVPVDVGGSQGGMGRSLALGTRNVIEGLSALPGVAIDAASIPQRLLGFQTPRFSEAVGRGLDALGFPQPETRTERVVGRAVQEASAALPTMGAGALMAGARQVPNAVRGVGAMLAANPGTQMVAGGASGLAAQTAREEGAGPIGEAAAGLAGGVSGALGMEALKGAGRFVASALEPFSSSGPDRIAGRVLLQSSADPEGLANRVQAGMNDPTRRVPGAPATTAQAAQDPGLAILESGLRNDPTGGAQSPAVMLRNVEFARNQARQAALEGASPMAPGQAPDALGATVRDVLRGAETRAKAGVRQAFQSVERDAPAQIDPAPVAMAVAEGVRRQPGQVALPADLMGAIDDLANQTRPVSIQYLQNIRSRLGVAEGQAARASDNVTAAAAKTARETLGNMLDDAAATGAGVTPDQLAAWRNAIGMRREMGATFGRSGEGAASVASILRRDQFGAPMLANERVADTALASPTAVRQVLRAAGQEGASARQALKARFVDRFMEAAQTRGEMADAAGNVATPLSPAQAKGWWQRNEAVAKELFSPQELSQLQRLMRDFSETAAMAGTAAARGSPTAQNLIVGNMIARTTGGLVDPTNPAAQTVVGLGPTLRLLYSAPEAATREALARALVNPQEASRILSLAGPQGAQMGAGYANQQFRDRLAQALMGEMVRGAARTGNALAIQGQSGP